MSAGARREVLGRDSPESLEVDRPAPDGLRDVDPEVAPAEEAEDAGLRPRTLAEFIGQGQLTEHLRIVIEAARKRQQPVDHLLFAGPPGLGKTSLAGIVAAEMGVGLRVTAGPVLVRTGDLAALLTDLQEGDVLFIDEIHRLHRSVEEILYPAMEDFKLDILIGKGPTARSIRLDLPRFSLVGATTRTGLVAGPLRDRFGFVGRLDHYDVAELQAIVLRSASILGVPVDAEGARRIAERSRGTPRIANRLLRRVRDYVEVRAEGTITSTAAVDGLEVFGVDELGLDKVDRAILDVLCRRFAGRAVGLTTLAQCVGEEPDTIEDAYEPYLLQQGLVQRTTRGRVAAPRAWAHLGLTPVANTLL
ncbi:MAG TPA: Holliday junction branch migration DNA helicase RuvB [Acidimicrobiales bacterium]|jgi:Holliday junction DNA helicase RuvB|nr:Holliday junction branch migration DNA helicase RuvB [Acidimicrobiales bacterium]